MDRREIDVVAGVIWRDGRYLAVSRPPGKLYAGLYEFPGGKIERGEEPEQALYRELAEELGIRVREIDFLLETRHAYPEFSVRLLFYSVSDYTGTVEALEGQTWQWLAPEEAETRAFLPADRDIVRLLREKAPRLAGNQQP